MNEDITIKELLEILEKEMGDCISIQIIDRKGKDIRKLNRCYKRLEEFSPSENFGEELSNILATFESYIASVKNKDELEEYIENLNELLNDIIEESNYSIEIKLK